MRFFSRFVLLNIGVHYENLSSKNALLLVHINKHKQARTEQIILKSTFVKYHVRFYLCFVSKKGTDVIKWFQNQPLGVVQKKLV